MRLLTEPSASSSSCVRRRSFGRHRIETAEGTGIDMRCPESSLCLRMGEKPIIQPGHKEAEFVTVESPVSIFVNVTYHVLRQRLADANNARYATKQRT
mmetsp:Transcript_20425/g.64222  ORF Transcript_20425/g.64222 Transcript_20425/m.64222 type:complete len:98 (+) Transcript_20425:526-819(+)